MLNYITGWLLWNQWNCVGAAERRLTAVSPSAGNSFRDPRRSTNTANAFVLTLNQLSHDVFSVWVVFWREQLELMFVLSLCRETGSLLVQVMNHHCFYWLPLGAIFINIISLQLPQFVCVCVFYLYEDHVLEPLGWHFFPGDPVSSSRPQSSVYEGFYLAWSARV